jgi:hypothetical protein
MVLILHESTANLGMTIMKLQFNDTIRRKLPFNTFPDFGFYEVQFRSISEFSPSKLLKEFFQQIRVLVFC